MKKAATQTFAFLGASITPALSEVLRKRCRAVAAIKAESIGWARPALMGSKPLLKGRKAPPHPAIDPQKMGPKTGKPNSEGAIASPAAMVSLQTTYALRVS
jgi:hypothetical protein